MGNCVAKMLQFCVCVWKATKPPLPEKFHIRDVLRFRAQSVRTLAKGGPACDLSRLNRAIPMRCRYNFESCKFQAKAPGNAAENLAIKGSNMLSVVLPKFPWSNKLVRSGILLCKSAPSQGTFCERATCTH